MTRPLPPSAARSAIMRAVPSSGARSTEMALRRRLKDEGIKGWRAQPPVHGRPDFAFMKERVAVFVDGCFWHGCSRCLRLPLRNRDYWKAKIARNRARDLRTRSALRRRGWSVITIREHELKERADAPVRRLVRVLSRRGSPR